MFESYGMLNAQMISFEINTIDYKSDIFLIQNQTSLLLQIQSTKLQFISTYNINYQTTQSMKQCLIEAIKKNNVSELFLFVIMICALNYLSSIVQQSTNQLLVAQSITNHQTQRHVFTSFNSLMLLRKASVFVLSLFLIKFKNWANKNMRLTKNQHLPQQNSSQTNRLSELTSIGDSSPRQQESPHSQVVSDQIQRQSFHISPIKQIILGILSFGSILIFAQLQQTMNVYFIIEFKYIAMLFIILAIHLTVKYTIKKAEHQIKQSNSLFYKMFYSVPIILLSMFIKLNLTGLPGLYMANLGNSQETLTIQLILKMTGIIFMDTAFYTILFVEKHKYYSRKNLQTQNIQLMNGISSEKMMFSMSKYLTVFFFLLLIWKGQLSFLLQFIAQHPYSGFLLVKMAFFYFLQQFLVYSFLIKYDEHVFFSIMGMIGLHTRIYDYILRFWNFNTLIAVGLTFTFALLLRNAIKTKNKARESLNDKNQLKEFNSELLELIRNLAPVKYFIKKKKITI